MFEKLTSFTKKVADLSDRPSLNPTELKAQFDAAPDEVRVYLNKLIDALTKTTAGDSGAKNIGVTSISGVTGNDIQTILEGLVITSGSNANGFYVKYPDGTLICYGSVAALAGTGIKTIGTITYPAPFVGVTPYVIATHRSIAGRFADYYILDPKLTDFGLVHQGSTDLSGTIFTWQAIGKWK
jgi:hypothetical protein